MTALRDGQLIAVVHNGAAIVVFCRRLRQRSENIQLCNRVCRALDAVQLSADAFQQFTEQAVFQRDQPLVRT